MNFRDVSVDYAFLPYQNLGASHRVELSIAFGAKPPTKPATVTEPPAAPVIEKPEIVIPLTPAPTPTPKLIPAPLLAKTTIAIMDLAVTEGISASDVVTISELLRTAIINTNAFTVIERGKLDIVMAELGFQQTGCTDQGCAIKIGKLLNAHKVIVGSVGKLGTMYLVNIRLVDVETSKVEYADKGRASAIEEIEQTVEELAKN